MLATSKRLGAEIQSLRLQLEQLPEGNLLLSFDGKYRKWYHIQKGVRKYIPRSQKPLAEKLAVKKFLSLKLKRLQQEKEAADAYLKLYPTSPTFSSELLNPDSPYSDLLSPYFLSSGTHFQEWMSTKYEKNPFYPEQLMHKTSSGDFVRSKSEALIDTLLYMNKIPFRYECALHLGEVTIYPDFTILHPITGKIYYWEHFGLMDDSAYSQKAFSKLQLYTSHGIIPSHQLIITFETKEQPLNSDYVNQLIQLHFS